MRYEGDAARESVMRKLLALAALVAAPLALQPAPAYAQPRTPPPGSYRAHCRDIYMEGQFLHAWCQGPRGSGPSSINVESCSTDIFVNETGGLTCIGPGGGAPPRIRDAPPGFSTVPPTPQARPPGSRWDRDRAYRRQTAVLYRARRWRGAAVRISGPAPNLADSGLNDRVGSIRIEPGDLWLVCEDAGFQGRCVRIDRSVADTRELGMRRAISSLRPLR
jgi:hypothetical protein